MRNKSLQIQMPEINAEWKAFVYQQMAEFEPYFMPDSNVGIKVNQLDSGAYTVVLTLSGGGTYVRSQGQSEDLFDATAKAKDELLGHLRQIESLVVSGDDRERAIDLILQSSPYLH